MSNTSCPEGLCEEDGIATGIAVWYGVDENGRTDDSWDGERVPCPAGCKAAEEVQS